MRRECSALHRYPLPLSALSATRGRRACFLLPAPPRPNLDKCIAWIVDARFRDGRVRSCKLYTATPKFVGFKLIRAHGGCPGARSR